MKKAVIYPSTSGERFEYRGVGMKTKCLICGQNIGRQADKPMVLNVFKK